ncbi:MAG: hypothetical protein Q8O33_12890 [Pseudomonadota bacterium]|nr:hypothetical protein [Pseudomonadota bacterium]
MAKQRTPTPVQGTPYFILSEEQERQLWKARDLIHTLGDLLLSYPPHVSIQLATEPLSATLFLAVDLLDLHLTYVPTRKEV